MVGSFGCSPGALIRTDLVCTGKGMARIQVVRFKQNGFTLYSGVMTVDELLAHARTTEWDPGQGWALEGQGYQRAPEQGHSSQIGTFLRREGDPLLPTNALPASRNADYGELHFDPVAGDMGYLDVPENRPLFVVDYQHRWRGFKHAIEDLKVTSLRTMKIPVTILADAPVIEETKQFYLINSKQKRVDTDLALTLMNAMSNDATEEELANLVGPGNRYRIRGTRIVVRIAQLGSGPWLGKIEEPNGIGNHNQIASIKSFVDSLRPMVGARSPVYHLPDKDLLNIILSVWTGVLDLWPEWSQDFPQYAVQRSVGLFVVHRVARQLLIPRMIRTNYYSSRMVTDALSPVKSSWLDRDFWRTGGEIGSYSSGAGQKELADRIIRAVPQDP